MAAPKGHKFNVGNKHAVKLKTLDLKQEAYKQYCDHLAKGKSKKSWYFEHPHLILTWQTMERYIADEPNVFNPLQKEVAYTKGYQRWEQVVEDSAEGKNKDANTASLQMLMRNKYDWDKENSGQKETTAPLIQRMAEKWRK